MNNTNYFAKVAQQNKLNELSDVLKDIEINQSLLTQIQNYIREVETNPNYEKTAIIEIPDIDSDMAIGFERLDSDMGIRISVCLEVMMKKEIYRFKNCDLYDLFVENNDGNMELNLPYDTETICLVIQYLSKVIYNKSDGINLDVFPTIDSSVSDNNVEKTKYIIGSVLCFVASIFLFITFFSFGDRDTQSIIGAIVALVSGIFCVKKARTP